MRQQDYSTPCIVIHLIAERKKLSDILIILKHNNLNIWMCMSVHNSHPIGQVESEC